MEHRWHQRKPVELDMIARSETLGSICGRTRNISLGGLLLDTGAVSLAPHVVIELCCCLLFEQRCRSYSVRAQVVYTDRGCAGLMFLDHEAAYAKFEAALQTVTRSPRAKEISSKNCSLLSPECVCGCRGVEIASSNRVA